jgi:hypothetical protein
MRCCKCNSDSNVLVCETQGKVCICMGNKKNQGANTCDKGRIALVVSQIVVTILSSEQFAESVFFGRFRIA